jgi:hypothetical protein
VALEGNPRRDEILEQFHALGTESLVHGNG